jgi:phosphatidylserine/phosphatidylglycerophosphate/cardiolipin synthase-like enzyme
VDLLRAARRGVAVTVILEKSGRDADPLNNDNLHTASMLTRGGVRVRFDSPATTSHGKVAVIDSRHVYLGSHNLTQAALRHNNEFSVLIDSPEMALEVLRSLEAQ